MWDICGGYVPWLKYLKISWVRYLQYPHCWGHTLSQWGDAIDAWTVWITYTCFKMSWYVLYQHPRWNQVLYECVSQTIWITLRAMIYIYIYTHTYTCTYYWYVWLFERVGRLNRTVFTNNIQRYDGYVYQHCGQRTARYSQHISSIQVYSCI